MKLVAFALGLLVAAGRPVHADDDLPPQDVVAVMGGPSLGVAIHGADNGFLLGGEVSAMFVRLANRRKEVVHWGQRTVDVKGPRIYWGGIYLDTLHDFSADTTRLTVGPELGISILGVDGGFVHEFASDLAPARNGLALRPVLTFGLATIYFRHVWFSGESHDEVGILFKVGPSLYDSLEDER